MRRLVRWAKGKRLARIFGDVLEENEPMLALAKSLSFQQQAVETPGMVRVSLELKRQVVDTTPNVRLG